MFCVRMDGSGLKPVSAPADESWLESPLMCEDADGVNRQLLSPRSRFNVIKLCKQPKRPRSASSKFGFSFINSQLIKKSGFEFLWFYDFNPSNGFFLLLLLRFNNKTFDYSPTTIRISKDFLLFTETNLFNFPAFNFFNGFSTKNFFFVRLTIIFYYNSESFRVFIWAEARRSREKLKGKSSRIRRKFTCEDVSLISFDSRIMSRRWNHANL